MAILEEKRIGPIIYENDTDTGLTTFDFFNRVVASLLTLGSNNLLLISCKWGIGGQSDRGTSWCQKSCWYVESWKVEKSIFPEKVCSKISITSIASEICFLQLWSSWQSFRVLYMQQLCRRNFFSISSFTGDNRQNSYFITKFEVFNDLIFEFPLHFPKRYNYWSQNGTWLITWHLLDLLHSVAHGSTHFPCLHAMCAEHSALYVHNSSLLHSVSGWPLKPFEQLQIARWLVTVHSAFGAQCLSRQGSTHWRFLHSDRSGHWEFDVHLVLLRSVISKSTVLAS